MNIVRTETGLMVYKINDEGFGKILKGKAGKWVEKNFKVGGKKSVYEITEPSLSLTVGDGMLKVYMWAGFYIEQEDL